MRPTGRARRILTTDVPWPKRMAWPYTTGRRTAGAPLVAVGYVLAGAMWIMLLAIALPGAMFGFDGYDLPTLRRRNPFLASDPEQ